MTTAAARRRVVFILFAVALSAGLSLLATELVLRIFWVPPSFRSDIAFEAHPLFTAAPRPGVSGRAVNWEYEHAFNHTAQGLRGKSIFGAGVAPAMTHRVLFLGDSFTYGIGAGDDETFVARIDAALPEVEVINAGSNGYGQREELAVLDVLGEALRPDLTVVLFFWNDLEDNLRREAPEFGLSEGGEVVRLDAAAAAAAAGYDALAPREAAPMPDELKAPRGSYLARLFLEGGKAVRYRVWGIKRRYIGDEATRQKAWEVTSRLLDLMKRRAEAMDSELVVVSIPDHNRVDAGARIRGIEPMHIEIEEDLARVCAGHAIRCINLLEGMRAQHAQSDAPLYYYADRHLTPRGNAAVAEILLPEIRMILENIRPREGRDAR